MTVGDLLIPQKDTLSNRVISFIASQIFDTDVAPQLNDVRFYLWTRSERNKKICIFTGIYKLPFCNAGEIQLLACNC